ncbi:TetR family transcriptional regulator [Planomonospora parontospora subsp. parontospora]|uniref:TetR family transcriptional regulator n=2 Tax=Planomonospora parontospora TaxID=58119 RepID=A0AA37F575_9ACTN|nr:TetR/AcrR family transcriptional regulator [Planomonospora parontospora]GGK70919.1 TetR family transcriptional regulator [Planomonospora parontospora]GII09743.1 TetR family transcriptional regulator [Planomonospora parontospora subsp. parontospora]
MSTQTTGLRELKKQQTRENISHQATRLFLERGFDKVTIADVAAAAQVAKMTVTNYFPRKEDLALDLSEAFVQSLARTVRERGPGESALAALRRAYLAAVAEHSPVIGFSGPEFARMITDSPALTARLREFHDERERALADALTAEAGTGAGDILPTVAAALLSGVHRLLFDETLRRTLDGQGDAEIAEALTGHIGTAFDVLEPALGDYAVRPAG